MQQKLVRWYMDNHRNLPWRQNHDPYHIWISEIMLQQTRVDTVIPYYLHFFEVFPDLKTLASSSQDTLYSVWQGLGYYSRVRNIQKAANQILEDYQGIFPDEVKELSKLSGIGPYTSRAIASIAFGRHVAAIDGNALRIISRLKEIDGNIQDKKTIELIQNISDEMIQDVEPGAYNQAIMDLGSSYCSPKSPDCLSCPIHEYCQAYLHGTVEKYPVNIKNIKIRTEKVIAGIIENKQGILLVKTDQGLLRNLYGTPQYFTEQLTEYIEHFEQDYSVQLTNPVYLGHVKHVFTHRIWEIEVYHFTIHEENKHMISDINSVPISTCHKKILKLNQK